MTGELEYAKVRGLSFIEYQVEIVKLVKHFISKNYVKYPVLKNFGVNKEDVEVLVYQSLYNRKDINKLSNMERYFLKASELSEPGVEYGKDTKYLVCLIQRVVSTSFSQLSRKVLSKDIEPPVSYYESINGKEDYLDRYIGKNESYNKLHYEDVLRQVKQITYPYYVMMDDEKKPLTSRLFLDLTVSGYNRKDL